jgi:hypothetical protein
MLFNEQKAAPEHPRVMGAEAPPGSKSEARRRRRHRNLGDLIISREHRARKPEEENPRPARVARVRAGASEGHKQSVHTEYRRAKENEAKRNG